MDRLLGTVSGQVWRLWEFIHEHHWTGLQHLRPVVVLFLKE